MAHFKLRLTLIFLVFATGMMATKVDSCSDQMGECASKDECSRKCQEKHPGGEVDCNVLGGVIVCTCYYTGCKLPPPQRCTEYAGSCSIKHCDENCCKGKCQAKWPNSEGYCQDTGAAVALLCMCSHDC